jgi:hypothetical protein
VPEHSTAKLTGCLGEWAVLEDKCKNQKFNAGDSSPLPRNRLWPELARWYGCAGFTGPETDDSKFTAVNAGQKKTPVRVSLPYELRYSFTLSKWAEDPKNQKAWKDITDKHNLTHNPLNDIEGHLPFGDHAAWDKSLALSMNKARLFGWNGHVDTLESLHLAFDEMNKIEVLPPLVAEARPLI